LWTLAPPGAATDFAYLHGPDSGLIKDGRDTLGLPPAVLHIPCGIFLRILFGKIALTGSAHGY